MARIQFQFLSLLFLLPSVLAFNSDFSFYPQKAQPCLNTASKTSKCTGADAKALNVCLCGNGGNFIINSAQCLGREDKNDVKSVYSTMSGACADSGTPMTVSQQEFYDAANGVVKTTTSAVPSATSTSSATGTSTSATATATDTSKNKDNNKSEGLSKGAVIGIAVGAAVVGVVATMAVVMFCLRRRKRQTEVESHPMLGQSEYYHNGPTTFPPSEPSPDFGQYSADQKAAWGTSPSPGVQSPQKSPAPFGAAYDSHRSSAHDQLGVMQGLHPSGARGAAEQTFELDGSSAPPPTRLAAEMEGSQPPRHSGYY